MPQKLHPIQDEVAAEKALNLFMAGFEPLLYAAEIGVTPEQVWDTLRLTLRHCRDNHARPTAGRPREKKIKPKSEAQRRWRDGQKSKK